VTEVNDRAVRPDDELAQRLRGLVADRMAQQAGRDGTMTAAARSRLGRALIREVLEEEAEAALTRGRPPLDQAAEQQVADRVYADLWGLGGFQPYLDDPDVESVNANGCDQVFVQYSGGYRSQVPPVAASDQELTDLIRAIAARGGIEERRFDRSSPRVSVPLPGGGRLFAVQAVTGRPCVAIRRDRLERAGLRELVRNGTVDEPLAAFLAALVKARKNLLISGGGQRDPQGRAADHHRGLSRAVPGLGHHGPP
jgi:pilus assembly protein CpaF